MIDLISLRIYFQLLQHIIAIINECQRQMFIVYSKIIPEMIKVINFMVTRKI